MAWDEDRSIETEGCEGCGLTFFTYDRGKSGLCWAHDYLYVKGLAGQGYSVSRDDIVSPVNKNHKFLAILLGCRKPWWIERDVAGSTSLFSPQTSL